MPIIVHALLASFRFALNKIRHGQTSIKIHTPALELHNLETLHFFSAADENGILRGGDLPWLYIDHLFTDKTKTDDEKEKYLQKILAKLPSSVAFSFAVSPRTQDTAILRKAFKKSGFIHTTKRTHTFFAGKDDDIYKMIKSDTRNKINAGRRDLELVPMNASEFFAFYNENLTAAGKKNYFNQNIDRDLVNAGLAMTPPQIHILAARYKQSVAGRDDLPFEAAAICAGGADGFLKLMRITYRHQTDADTLPPHKHGIKFLVFEAMNRAAAMGLILDTDGFTPGGDTLYSRFGVFQSEIRDEFKRKTVHTLLGKIWPF